MLSEESTKHRARIASLTRRNHDGRHSAELVEARRDFAAARIADHIAKVVAAAPPLSDEQCTRLTELLRPVRHPGGGAA